MTPAHPTSKNPEKLNIKGDDVKAVNVPQEVINRAIDALRYYQTQDDGTAKLLAGFNERPDTVDERSRARLALREIERYGEGKP